MDADGSYLASANSGDVDQNLLMQFSCMNTTDREELISQLQTLLGPMVTYSTASFFLDMNSWNLQAAVCSYLDYYQPPKPSMSLKASESHEEAVCPGTVFQHSWSIANTGAESWPGSCQIVQAGGEWLGAETIYVAPLPPGHSITATASMKAPEHVGRHRGFFHLLTSRGDKIGDTLWVEITVESENAMAIVDQMAALPVPSVEDEAGTSHFTQAPPPLPPDDQMC